MNNIYKVVFLALVLLCFSFPKTIYAGGDRGDKTIAWVEQHLRRLSEDKTQEEIRNKISTIQFQITSNIFNHTEDILREFEKVKDHLNGISGFKINAKTISELKDSELQKLSETLITNVSKLIDLRTQTALASYKIKILIDDLNQASSQMEKLHDKNYIAEIFTYKKISDTINSQNPLDGIYFSHQLMGGAAANTLSSALEISANSTAIISMIYYTGTSLYNIYKNEQIERKLKHAKKLWDQNQISHEEFLNNVSLEIEKKISPLKQTLQKAQDNAQNLLLQVDKIYDVINIHIETSLLQFRAIQAQRPRCDLRKELEDLELLFKKQDTERFYYKLLSQLKSSSENLSVAYVESKFRNNGIIIKNEKIMLLERKFQSLVQGVTIWQKSFQFTEKQKIQIQKDIKKHKALLESIK